MQLRPSLCSLISRLYLIELPAPTLQSYPRETVVAEKFQAMVLLGIANSRMKDFFDIFTLCSQFEFDGQLSGTPFCVRATWTARILI